MNAKQNYKWNELTMGTCYYPEHWDKKLWADDLDRMKKTGISVIRIAEFAWSKVEPEEGVFTYDFFDEFLDLCSEKQMKVIFGTPTATPPAWLTEKYPEVLNARKDGVLLRHGGRRHYNYNSPVYQRLCARVVEREAAHYAKHPAIVGWQIDNEINCEENEFYSEADSVVFREFLRKQYGTLEKLNEAWGTTFWNQTYTACGLDVAAVGGGLRDLSRQARRGHLAAGHAVDGVVDENHGDVFASGGGADGLAQADGGKVAVALIGEDDVVGQRPLHACGDRGGAAVGGLDHVAGEVVRGEPGAADRRDADGPALDAQLVDALGDEAVDDAVRTAGAVVQNGVGQRSRFFKDGSHAFAPPSAIVWMLASTSSGVGIIPPTRRQSETGFLQRTASSTSCFIWPILSSTHTKPLTLSAAASRGLSGKGQSVMGLMSPTLKPSSFRSSMADLQIRATVPKAVTIISAFSML